MDIITELEACHSHFEEYIGLVYDFRHIDERYLDLLGAHRALIDRLKARKTCHYVLRNEQCDYWYDDLDQFSLSVDDMAKLTPEGET